MWVTVAAAVLMLASLGESKRPPETPSLGEAADVPIFVEDGDTVTLTCTSATSGVNFYEWRVDGMTIAGETGQTYEFQVDFDFDADTSQNYTCIAYIIAEEPSDPSPPAIVFPLPRSPTLSPNVEGEVEAGASVTFTCTTESEGVFVYVFFKDGVNVSVASTSATYTTDPLTIDDSGVPWTCVIPFGFSTLESDPVLLEVIGLPEPPTLSSSVAGQVEEGTSVTFTCATETEGEFVYDFLKDGGLVVSSRSGTFTINGLAVEDSGTWTCGITSPGGTVLSSGPVQLSVTESELDDTGAPLSFVAIRSSVIIGPGFFQPVLQAVFLRFS